MQHGPDESGRQRRPDERATRSARGNVHRHDHAHMKPKLVGINHVAIEVGNVEDALEFYGRIFELRLRGRAGRMAFIDIGDQFIALAEGRSQPPDAHRHFGLVVDDREAALAAAREAGAQVRGTDFRDPWGNNVQVVAYEDVQFTKSPEILSGMGLEGLEKTEQATAELRAKGLA
jgi:lactoylglutathione lyase